MLLRDEGYTGEDNTNIVALIAEQEKAEDKDSGRFKAGSMKFDKLDPKYRSS